MSKRNYKVHAEMGTGGEEPTRLLTVLNTGAGPNLIRRKELPKGLSHVLQDGLLPNICEESCRTIHRVGKTKLELKLGQYRLRLEFIVCE